VLKNKVAEKVAADIDAQIKETGWEYVFIRCGSAKNDVHF
jgi:hypothetical protein